MSVKILLTATVTPQVTWDLHITDPGVRRQQYLTSLREWQPIAAAHDATLVLIENSGEDLEVLTKDALGEVPDNVRLINAKAPRAEDIERGKGATEAAMMDEFCETFFEDPDENWYKVTGRLVVRNFSRCIPATLPAESMIGRCALDMRQIDTRFFGATAGVWKRYFLGAGPSVRDRDEVFIEKVLMKRIFSAMGDGVKLYRFAEQPAWLGRSGTHEDRQYDSLKSRVKRIGTNKLEDLLKGRLANKFY